MTKVAYDLSNVLYLTQRVIAVDGWTSKDKAAKTGNPSTADTVHKLLDGDMELWERYKDANLADDLVNAAIGWAKSLSISGNDFFAMIGKMARTQIVPEKCLSFAVALLPSYQRQTQPKSAHVGTTGQVMELTVRVDWVKTFAHPKYGTTILHRMVDENGNIIKWFCREGESQLSSAAPHRIKAKILHHEWYNSQAETVIGSVSLLSSGAY